MKRYLAPIAVLALATLAVVLYHRTGRHGDPVRLRVIGEAVSTIDAVEAAAKEYSAKTGIQIVVEKYEFETALQKSTLDLTSKTGQYDIILQYAAALGKFARQGHIFKMETLTHSLPPSAWGKFKPAKDLFPNVWNELSWYDSTCYGYPFAANTMYMWYRKDLLTAPAEKSAFRTRFGYDLKAPETWQQYRDIAEFFTRPSEGLYGTAIQGKRHPAVWYEWLNFSFSFGGGVMDKKHGWEYGPIVVNSPENIQATKFYKSLLAFSPPGATNYTWDDALTSMQQGKIALAVMWSDAVAGLEDPKSSRVAGKMGYAPLPAGPRGSMAQIAGGSYFVSRYSKHPGESIKFILWLMQPENQVKQQLHGGSSAAQDTYLNVDVSKIPYTQAQLESLKRARYMTDSVPETDQISDILQVNLSEILTGQTTVEIGLNKAALAIHNLCPEKCPMKYPVSF